MKLDDKWMGGLVHFEEASKEEVLELIKVHGNKNNMEEQQNNSPSIREFLELADRYPTMRFHGYIVDKTRSDYRVSIEGFDATYLNADQALALVNDYRLADECTNSKKNGSYEVFTWWD